MAAAVPERKKLSVKPNLWLFVILERIFDLLCSTFIFRRFMFDFSTFYVGRNYVRPFMFDVLCSIFYVRSFMFDLLCLIFYVLRFLFDVLCSTFNVRPFCVRPFRPFMFDLLCSTFHVWRFIFDVLFWQLIKTWKRKEKQSIKGRFEQMWIRTNVVRTFE